MNKILLIGLVLSSSFLCLSQEKVAEERDELLLRKQMIVSDLESQIKNNPLAAVRVYAGYRVASWLWRTGKDDTGRAEDIAATAIGDYYQNKAEIPFDYYLDSQLFVLLDAHAKDSAKQLREKYKTSSDDDARLIPSLLAQKNGEKLAVDAAVRLLAGQNESSPDLMYLLIRLEQQRSPELNRLLGSILAAEESSRTTLSTNTIEMFTGFFMKPNVPIEMRTRFLRLVLARSRNVAALSVPDQWAYYRTLQRLLPDLAAEYPELLAEAGVVHALLSAQVTRSTREANDRNERLRNSSDKLAATVAEAEREDDGTTKYSLYRSAARLALAEKKFVYAADLMEKASETKMSGSLTPKEETFRSNLHDEFYRDVVTKSLEASESDAANHSVKKMNAPLSKGEGLRRISKYHIEKKDPEAGRQAHDEAIKLIGKMESSPEAIATLLRMLPTTQKLDPARVFELSQLIAKSINTIPSLTIEDKPDTKNYQDYVRKMMAINFDLQPALTALVKVDRSAAADIADRIEKKEIRIIADYVLLTDSIDNLPKQRKNLETANLPSPSP
jgi:hypothetical protein